MLVTDLDNTLLRTDKTISDYTQSIFKRCKESGILVAFATARSENSCKKYIDLIKPDAVISNGGARVRIGEQTVYRAVMNVKTTNDLLLECLKKPSVGYITIDTDKGYFVNKPVDASDSGWFEYLPAHHVDFSYGLDCEAYKITVEISDNTTAYEIASKHGTVDVLAFSGERWFRFADKTADKWRGIEALAKHLDIGISHIAAFGDDYNDITMLRGCNIGIAVLNAIEEAKATANFVCDTNDNDGVARWIEENIL
jgi:hypothetical protein